MRTTLIAAAVPVVLLSGCAGGAGPGTGPEVLADAVADLERAGSVRVEGTLGTGEPFDLHVQGDDAVGTVGMGNDHDAPFVAVDGQGYLLPAPTFFVDLGATEEEAAPLRGRYVTMPDDAWREAWPGSLDDVVDLLPAPTDVAEEVEAGTLDGEPVVVLTAADGVRLTVRARAPHHPVRLELPAEGDAQAGERTIRFSDVGERRTVVPPDDPVPAEVLGG